MFILFSFVYLYLFICFDFNCLKNTFRSLKPPTKEKEIANKPNKSKEGDTRDRGAGQMNFLLQEIDRIDKETIENLGKNIENEGKP